MKKTALTFVALAFGMGVTFAQTAPQQEEQPPVATEQSVTIDKLSNKPAEATRRTIKIEELPAEIQEQLTNGEFKDLKVVAAAEVQPTANTQAPAASVQYEVSFVEATTEAVTEPSMVVLFDEKGKVISRQKPADEQLED